MTRKIIDVPWNVSTSLYEFFVRRCSFGVASCARMSSAMAPPPAKKTSAVAMYMIPIRLWSTVTSHRATRPLRHETGLPATRACPLEDVTLCVLHQRLDLRVRPRVRNGRHLPESVADDRREALRLGEQRVRRDRRAVAALAGQPVAGRADARELALAEALCGLRRDKGLVVGRRG